MITSLRRVFRSALLGATVVGVATDRVPEPGMDYRQVGAVLGGLAGGVLELRG